MHAGGCTCHECRVDVHRCVDRLRSTCRIAHFAEESRAVPRPRLPSAEILDVWRPARDDLLIDIERTYGRPVVWEGCSEESQTITTTGGISIPGNPDEENEPEWRNGRRAGFKIPLGQLSGGSSPPSGSDVNVLPSITCITSSTKRSLNRSYPRVYFGLLFARNAAVGGAWRRELLLSHRAGPNDAGQHEHAHADQQHPANAFPSSPYRFSRVSRSYSLSFVPCAFST